MANQFSDRPPFCDFLERYQAAFMPKWKGSQLSSQRVGIGRFDEWLKVCGYSLKDLNWQTLLEFHRFLAAQGVSPISCQKSVQAAKHALRWAIERGELPQKMEDIYTFRYNRHEWKIDLPPLSKEFLSPLEPTRPGSYKSHLFAHRIFHIFLREKNLTYRRLRSEHIVAFVKFINQKEFHQRTRATLALQVRVYLIWLHRRRKISRDPDELLPSHLIPKRYAGLPRPLDPAVDRKLQELLESVDDLYYMAILLLRRTGLRIAELRKLEFDCIQMDKKGRAALMVPAVKLGLERRVPLDAGTVALIKKIQIMSLKNYKKNAPPKVLIIGPRGMPPRYERFSAALTEICARLGVKKWINLHSLRHTYATSMLNAGLSITSLKEMLGHKAINMSLVYAKVSQEKIHAEYSEALLRMSEKQIPKILESAPSGPSAAFADLGSLIAKSLDGCSDPEKQKRLQALRARLAKLKMELLKTL
jgi:integrase/recombinase XerC